MWWYWSILSNLTWDKQVLIFIGGVLFPVIFFLSFRILIIGRLDKLNFLLLYSFDLDCVCWYKKNFSFFYVNIKNYIFNVSNIQMVIVYLLYFYIVVYMMLSSSFSLDLPRSPVELLSSSAELRRVRAALLRGFYSRRYSNTMAKSSPSCSMTYSYIKIGS